ncbi:MAG: arylamine N-acetyltransferase [Candidatus Geothermarchaeales archaeon]
MNAIQYLDRIRIDRIQEPGHAFLAELQRHHLLAVPFENLDVLRGWEIVLDVRLIYEKIVVQRRGGFCYELNGLFCWLLRELGLSVSMVSAQVYENDTFTPEFDHMVLLVDLDKTYLVDVGFGDSFRKPLAVPNGEVEDISGRYRVLPSGQDMYLVQRQRNGEWLPEYSFTTHPREMSDFAGRCVFHQTSPDSHFTQRTICTIATGRGRVTLSDTSLTVTRGKVKRKTPVPSREEHRLLLLEHFGIELEKA